MTSFFKEANTLPIIAILRGIQPSEVSAVFKALLRAGISTIEIPLNSPSPYESIASAVAEFSGEALIGAGTVLSKEQVDKAAESGAELIVSPNTNADVISTAVNRGLVTFPGAMTPTEVFFAQSLGATGAKLFPVRALGEDYIGDLKSVLPLDFPLVAVGGVNATNAQQWMCAGVDALGVGGSIYRPGDDAETVYRKAVALVNALERKK